MRILITLFISDDQSDDQSDDPPLTSRDKRLPVQVVPFVTSLVFLAGLVELVKVKLE